MQLQIVRHSASLVLDDSITTAILVLVYNVTNLIVELYKSWALVQAE